jgi:thiol:disulfide interchange protein DsbD
MYYPTRSALHLCLALLTLLFSFTPVTAEPPATIGFPGIPSTIYPDEISVTASSTGTEIIVTFAMNPALHIYEDTIEIKLKKPSALHLGTPLFPVGIKQMDELIGKERVLLPSGAQISIPFRKADSAVTPTDKSLPGEKSESTAFDIEVSWQACSGDMCMMPETKTISFNGPLHGVYSLIPESANAKNEPPVKKIEVTEKTSKKTKDNSSDDQAKDWMKNWGILGYYFAGVLLSFTPCIFPMIPVTISIIGSKEGTPFQGFIRSIVYVTGLAITYATLGLIAAVSGGVIGSAMQNPAVLICVSALFFLMGLSMMDLFHFQLPSWLQVSGSGKRGSGYLSLFLTGLAAGLVASPCVAPVIIGVLLQIAAEGNLVMGFINLFALGWGIGTLLVIVGTFSSAMQAFPKAGNWMNEIKKGLGLILMGAAFYYLQGAVPVNVFALLLATFLIIAGIVSGATDSLPSETSIYPRIVKAMGVIFLIIGVYLLGGQLLLSGFIHPPLNVNSIGISNQGEPSAENPQWQPATIEKIAAASKAGRPVVLDFGAEWCGACHELEELTFSDPLVIESLHRFVSLKVDLTEAKGVPEELRKKYSVSGFPTLLFINSSGKILTELTSIGFIEPPVFIEKLNKVN